MTTKKTPAPAVPEQDFPELSAWCDAASVGGFRLPPEAYDFIEKIVHIYGQRATLPLPPAVPDSVDALIDGGTAADLYRADQRAAAALLESEGTAALVERAWQKLVNHAGVLAEHRDSLIKNELRRAVAALLAEAAPIARELEAFAPDFARAIAAKGDEAALRSWRSSRAFAERLGVYLRCWMVSFHRACVERQHGLSVDFRPQRAGGHYCWAEPEKVRDERLRLGHAVEPLLIASAASEYKLLAPSELQSVIESIDAEVKDMSPRPPWSGRTLLRRGVCS